MTIRLTESLNIFLVSSYFKLTSLLKNAGETVTIVGDHDPSLMKYFDCTRTSFRSPFDNNVVYQFEIMEYVSFFSSSN